MGNLITIDISVLLAVVMVVAVETIGIVQWLKNFVKPEKMRTFAIASALILVPCAFVHMDFVPPVWATIYDIYFLGMAVIQLAWDVVVKGVPQFVGGHFR
jgi:hypothetical protein